RSRSDRTSGTATVTRVSRRRRRSGSGLSSLQVLDQDHFVALLAVDQLVRHVLRHEQAEPPGPLALLEALLDVGHRVVTLFAGGRVVDGIRTEAGPRILHV